jgi:hypothetical protein
VGSASGYPRRTAYLASYSLFFEALRLLRLHPLLHHHLLHRNTHSRSQWSQLEDRSQLTQLALYFGSEDLEAIAVCLEVILSDEQEFSSPPQRLEGWSQRKLVLQ